MASNDRKRMTIDGEGKWPASATRAASEAQPAGLLRLGRLAALASAALLAAFGGPAAMAGSSVPPVVVTAATTVPATGLSYYQANLALDACGNIYTIQSGSLYSYPPSNSAVNGGQVTEIPAGGGAATTVLAAGGPNYDSNALFMDATKSNLYVTEGPYNVYKIPIVGCVPQPGSKTAFSIGNLGSVSYYWSAGAVAADAAGNVFMGTNADCCASGNELIEENAADSAGATLLINLKSNIVSIAVDLNSNLYYVAGGALYELPYDASTSAYAAAPISYGSGFSSNVVGVATDSTGNLYVSDGGSGKAPAAIFEIPNEASGSGTALSPADEFLVAVLPSTAAPISSPVALDPQGNLYFLDANYSGTVSYANSQNYIYEITRDNAGFAPTAVGASTPGTLTAVFNAAVTPTAIGFSTATTAFSPATGGTCAAGTAYTSGETCTIDATFTPTVPGLLEGSVAISDAAGLLDTVSLYGSGLGAGITADPGTVTSVGSGFKTPASAAIDSAGDLFVADSGNSVVDEIPAGATTPVAAGSGLSAPAGVAVDGAGNLFIADTGNNRIVEVPSVSGSLSTASQTVLVAAGTPVAGSALNTPSGVATDAQGNLYIADTGNNRIVFLPKAGNWNLDAAVTVGTGYSGPLAVAVAPSGLIYVADTGNGKIDSIPFPGAAAPVTAAITGLSSPSGLAVDAAGDLFVAEKGLMQVLRYPYISGGLAVAGAEVVSTGIADPYGVAIDSTGNLLITDDVNAAAYTVLRTSPTQSFGKFNPGETSTALLYSVENSGNEPLTLNTPYYAASGNTADFTLIATEAKACSAGATVASGASCNLEATFTPAAFGDFSETLTVSSNAKNSASPQLTFSGEGATTEATTTTLTITSPTGSAYFDEPVTLAVSVSSGKGTPIGTVAILVDGLQTTSAVLSAAGAASFTLSTLTGGTHTLQAVYEGSTSGFINYSHSESAVESIVVTRDATTLTLNVPTSYAEPASQAAGTAITLTATVSSTFAGIPTGYVQFVVKDSNGTSVTVNEPLAAAGGGLFQAAYTYTPPAPATGTLYNQVYVVATYSGDVNFMSSAQTGGFLVAPAIGSVGFSATGTTLTSSATANSAVAFKVTSYGGWEGVVGFTCDPATLPANAQCVFSPGQLSLYPSTPALPLPAASTTLIVTIDNPPTTPTASKILWWLGALGGLGLLGMRRRLHRRGLWATAALLVAVAALGIAATGLTACGSSSGSKFVTPAGTTTVTVYATGDPFTSASSTTTTQTCGVVPGSNPATTSPSELPCYQQSFQVALTVH